MKRYLAVYLGTPESMNSWNHLDERARQERMQKGFDAWGAWLQRNQKHIVDTGSPLGKTMKTSKAGVSAVVNEMTAYTVVEAESHEAAAKLFLDHPHFSIFPGDRVEIMECLPIPQKP